MTQPERDQQNSRQEQPDGGAASSRRGQQDAYEQSGLSEYGRSEGAGGSGQPLGQGAASDSGQRSAADKGKARRVPPDAGEQGGQEQQDAYEQSGLSEYGRSEGAGGSGQPLGQGTAADKGQARQS